MSPHLFAMIGEIYEDPYTSGKVLKQKRTTTKQDENWLAYMQSKLGTRDVYSLRHNCITYSEAEFDDAPGTLIVEEHWDEEKEWAKQLSEEDKQVRDFMGVTSQQYLYEKSINWESVQRAEEYMRNQNK